MAVAACVVVLLAAVFVWSTPRQVITAPDLGRAGSASPQPDPAPPTSANKAHTEPIQTAAAPTPAARTPENDRRTNDSPTAQAPLTSGATPSTQAAPTEGAVPSPRTRTVLTAPDVSHRRKPGDNDASSSVLPTTAPPVQSAAEPGCAITGGKALVRPEVTPAAARDNVTFCPIRLNGGSLPITGPFELDGQVLGPLAARQHIALINYGDPRTCDALGNPPTPGAFIAHGFSMSAPDGRWSFVDSLGYAQAVTIERQFSYVSASPSSIAAMLDDQQTWVAAHPDKADFYPGILKLPSDVRVLATFDVPAGVYEGTQPCQSR